jgi:hypothetical protein
VRQSKAWGMALVLGVLGAAPALAAQEPCGGLQLEAGQVKTGQVLAPQGADTEACLRHMARVLRERPSLQLITVAARLPDEQRLGGKGLEAARAAVQLMVAAGLPAERVNAVAPPAGPQEEPQLKVAYVERPGARAVARLRRSGGEVKVGPSATELKPRAVGDMVYAGELVRTGPSVRADLVLADGSLLRLAPDSLLKLTGVALNAQRQREVRLEVLQGAVETEAASSPQGAVFEVRTRTAVAGVRGTHFRTVAPEGPTRVETLEGNVALSSTKGEVEVKGGYGSRVKAEGEAPEAPRKLLAAPEVVAPRLGAFPLSPPLGWQPVPGARSYQVELARDADFLSDLRLYSSVVPALTLQPLEGKWFWRVLPVDADGFVGFPSKIYAFEVKQP